MTNVSAERSFAVSKDIFKKKVALYLYFLTYNIQFNTDLLSSLSTCRQNLTISFFMGMEDDKVLREAFEGLRKIEENRREAKKEEAEARVQAVVTSMEEKEAADARQAALVEIAAKEKSWPLVANQVKLNIF